MVRKTRFSNLKCVKCGRINDSDSNYCMYCGVLTENVFKLMLTSIKDQVRQDSIFNIHISYPLILSFLFLMLAIVYLLIIMKIINLK